MHYVFQELGIRKTIGTRHDQNRLYDLELACISTSSTFNYYYRLDHSSLPVLKLFVPSLSQILSLECKSYQLGKHHHMSYPSRVNKRADKSFNLVDSDMGFMYSNIKIEF